MATITDHQAPAQPAAAGPATARLELVPSPHFAAWLAERGASIAFTTNDAGKLFLIGSQPNGRLAIGERSFGRCTGLAGDGQTLWMSSLYQLWRFENVLAPKQEHRGHDRLFVPRLGYTTGDLDIHDIAIGEDGRPIFVNTRFSCLAIASDTHSFRPVWRPAFVSTLVPEDRCHLTGLAMAAGSPGYVTAAAETDAPLGWRDKRAEGGIAIDVASNQVVARGLSLPHAPRLHDGALWLLNSGSGHVGRCDLKSGRFEPVVFCAGYPRGFAIVDRFALVGTSLTREGGGFGGLALEDNLKRHQTEPRCALLVIDLKSGEILHSLEIKGMVREVHDLAILAGVRRPMALGFRTDEIRRILTIEDEAAA